jgi:Cu+-exporting ATPase
LLRLAAALQQGSEHSLAEAVRVAAAGQPVAAVAGFRALPGLGVSGSVAGRDLLFGNRRLMQDDGVATDSLTEHADALERSGHTVSWLAETSPAHRLLGLFGFADTVKPGSRAAIDRLKAAGLRTVMLTGDSCGAAEAVARDLGIDTWVAEVLPARKSQAVANLRREGKVVAMVGDGINDAPALAAADIGIAMATGTDVAMETAGITLMRGDPALVADAIDISRRTWNKIRQGLFWAFAYNILGIPLAVSGLLSPVLAGGAMALSSVSVVANALLLRRWRPEGS